MVLKGPAANKQELAQAFARPLGVMWRPICFFFRRKRRRNGRSQPAVRKPVELLSDTETAGMRAKLGLVVLNGCSSGKPQFCRAPA